MTAPRLENRLPDEGINSADEHPLRELAWLIGATLLVLALVVVLVGFGAQWLAPRLPFSVEIELAERLVDAPPALDRHPAPTPAQAALAARTAAMQALADRVAEGMRLPAGMAVVISLDAAPVVNAYATVGGRIRLYRGLITKLDSEDALAALLAHEIAHVKHRHVAASLGRGLALALLVGVISSDAGAAAAEAVIGSATTIALLGYSREHEMQADDEALRAVVALYGHAGGVAALFNTLGAQAKRGEMPIDLLRSHPLTQDRVDAARRGAAQLGVAADGLLTPMPAALRWPRPGLEPTPSGPPTRRPGA